MIQIEVNGKKRALPTGDSKNLGELMDHLASEIDQNKEMITGWKVNGQEITASAEQIRALSVEDINLLQVKLELKTAVLERSYESLEKFIGLTEDLISTLDVNDKLGFNETIIRLMDGVQTITDSVFTIRSFLKVGYSTKIKVLEEDLLSILKDTFEFQQKENSDYVEELLKVHLMNNLKDWRTIGIPELKSKPLK